MHTSEAKKTLFAKGVVGCNVSFVPAPFTSDSVNFFEASATRYGIMATDKKLGTRIVYIVLDKNITPGTYYFESNSEIFAYYYHEYENFGWTYYAEKGKLELTSVNFEKSEIDGKFEFTSTNNPDEPNVTVTNGVITLTGTNARRHTT
ncbi:hypothetical protein C4J96_4077 [Pseudomonas orientalis]|uniref:DUF6252 family protein n=1 Tax=Pseudomonas orientalis TaxID=76758 RepID=UPI000F563B2D|nr:DUF6252 family protein [Pseudomonas orientalis]AZE96166.1 hypothetical protein C4J96_4077 [Pseudomonas orientalis]